MQLSVEDMDLITSSKRLFEEVVRGDITVRELIEHCPISDDLVNEIERKIVSGHEDVRAGALIWAVEQLNAVRNPLMGLGGAAALSEYWRRRMTESNAGYVRHNMGLAIGGEMFSLYQLGQHDLTLSLAEQYSELVRDVGLELVAALISVYCAWSLLQLGRLEESRGVLPTRATIREAEKKEKAITGFQPRVELAITLRDNVATDASFMDEASIGELEDLNSRMQSVFEETMIASRSILERLGESKEMINALEQEIGELSRRPTNSTKSRLNLMADLMDVIRTRLAKYAPGLEFYNDSLRNVAEGLHESEKSSLIGASEESDKLMSLQNQRGDSSGWQSHAWLQSILFEKAQQSEKALEVLERIKIARAEAVAKAKTQRERAAIAGAFADLAPRLARLRMECGANFDAIFEAIEWGKGQWLADGTAAPTLSEFRAALARSRVNYLTFLSGSSFTVGMFVPSSGNVIARVIMIGRDQLETVISAIRNDSKYRENLVQTLSEELGVLMDWVPICETDGEEANGKVFVIAPHGPLYELPLHILPCAGGFPLVPRNIVVRSHGASALKSCLSSEAIHPRSYFALHVPLMSEVGQPARLEKFNDIVSVLARALPGGVKQGNLADYERLAQCLRKNQVVHLWAHGDSAQDGRYYSKTGLLLSAGGNLPQRGSSHFVPPYLLSPQRLLDTNPRLDFSGNHVTMQACVSAHAKANLQGDAIGLEWAFLILGAASVLGTYWHIKYSVASEFCRGFYENWLVYQLPRGEAWRRTVESMMKNIDSDDWAAFSLAGDWR